MIRPLRTTLALALAAAAAAAYIFTVEREDDSRRTAVAAARAAFRFNPARVQSLRIRNGAADLSVARDPADPARWTLVAPIAVRADASAIERLLAALRDLPSDDLILPPDADADPAAAYAPYGLDAPPVALSIVESAAETADAVTFLVGRRTPLGDGIYARVEGAPGIVRIATPLLSLIPSSTETLRSRDLLQGDPASVDRLEIRAPSAGFLQLAREKATGAWRIAQPISARADASIVAETLDALFTSHIEQFVQDNAADLAPYGLDSQSAVTAVLNLADDSGSQVLSVGDPLPNAPHLVYARIQGESSVYAVPSTLRTALVRPAAERRDRHVPGLDAPADIQRLRIEAPPAPPLELFRDADGAWFLASPLRAPADPATVEALLDALSSVRYTRFPAPGLPADADGAPPTADAYLRTLRITLAATPDRPVALLVAPADPAEAAEPGLTPPETWIALANDPASAAVASPATLLDASADPADYLSLDLLSIPADDLASIAVTSPSVGATYVHLADGNWSPALPDGLLDLLAPLRADGYLPRDDAPSDAPRTDLPAPDLLVTFKLRGATGIAHHLSIDPAAAGDPAPAHLLGRPYDFRLPPATVDAFRALLPPAPATEP